MRYVLRTIYQAEIVAAVHLGAIGDFWAASAARRLGKLSENNREGR